MRNADLSAAAVDAQRLQDFLVDDQKFDEVIVLRNEEATVDTINYFLEDYLVHRAPDFNNNARLFIAYSGHGRFGTANGLADTQAAFVLSGATDLNGYSNIYKMTAFAGDITALASRYFHVLTMINACYGGSVFQVSGGGNPASYTEPGSYVLTAGGDKDVAVSVDPKRGSIFFDQFISGVKSGAADIAKRNSSSIVDEAGSIKSIGIARTGPIFTYLTDQFEVIARARKRLTPPVPLSPPWGGAVQIGVARGGLFFLTPSSTPPVAALGPTVSQNTAAPFGGGSVSPKRILQPPSQPATPWKTVDYTAPWMSVDPVPLQTATTVQAAPAWGNVPPGPISSLPGRPDIKIFKDPDIYPVKGLDLSSNDGNVKWKELTDDFHPSFVYLRAIAWKGPDKRFHQNLQSAKELSLSYGAYLKFDFCLSAQQQLARFQDSFPPDPSALPTALELEQPEDDNHQLACQKKLSSEQVKQAILDLGHSIETAYGKTPILYGNRAGLFKFNDTRFNRFMIWLGNYGRSDISMPGRNPWTLWQYTGTANIKGIGRKSTANVFFGTRLQFETFKLGIGNTALQAVQPVPVAEAALALP